MGGVAAAAMVAAMVPGMAFAADITGTIDDVTTQGTTDVKYYVTSGYTWSVPSEIDFGKDKGVNQTSAVAADGQGENPQQVKVTKNVIPDGAKLQITAEGDGAQSAFTVVNGKTTLSYTVAKGDSTINPGDVVLSVNAGTAEGSQALTFTLSTGSNTAEVAGEYKGKVHYVASIVG